MNDIYAYFDYHGTLKERVSAPIRANSTQVNSIYAYWDNQSVEPVTYSVTWRLVGSDSFETTSEHYAETLAIPANYLGRRDLVFFKEAKLYDFIRFPVPSAVTAVAGTYVATIRYALSTQTTFVLGSLTFDVEGDQGIVLGESLTLDQYNYLLEQYSEVYDWATLRFLPLTGGTITGDLEVTNTIRANGNLAAKGYWLSSPDQVIIKLDNSIGNTGELQFGIPSGDYSPAFYGSLGVKMWDGRTKEYPTIRFDYYDGNEVYTQTVEESVATQEWANTQYLKLTGGTITGHTIFNSSATFNNPVTIYSPLTVQANMTFGGFEGHSGNEWHSGEATFTKNITISAATPTQASHATRKDYVDNLVASVKANAFQVVQALPQTGEEGIIYLVPVQGANYYTQYIWEGNSWIDIGDTEIDLSGYLPLTGGTITGDLAIDGSVTLGGKDLETELSEKADKTGYYGTMGAGYADTAKSLQTSIGRADETPFGFQTTGGSADVETGIQQLRKLVGVSVVRNQLVRNGNFDNSESWSVRGGSFSVSGNEGTLTINDHGAANRLQQDITTPIANHIYLICFYIKASTASVGWIDFGSTFTGYAGLFNIGTSYSFVAKIFQPTSNTDPFRLYINHNDGYLTNGDTVTFKKIRAIDLTQRYGNNDVVNAIIGNDSSTQVKKLLQFDPNILKQTAYDAGTLASSQSAKLKSVGYNQWDEQWELGSLYNGEKVSSTTEIRSKNYIPVIGGTEYRFIIPSGTAIYVDSYDINKNYIGINSISGSGNRTLSTNTAFIRFRMNSAYGTTYNHDICVFIYWDGSRTGYEPYESQTYDLPNIVQRGILKVDGSGNVYADGDEITPDGRGATKFALAKLKDLNWVMSGSVTSRFSAPVSGMKPSESASVVGNALCPLYSGVANYVMSNNPVNKTWAIRDAEGTLFIYDETYTDATTFKNHFTDNDYILYELATPVESESDPFPENVWADDFGTLQFLDSDGNEIVGLQGAEFFYQANIAGYAETLYVNTDGKPAKVVLSGYTETNPQIHYLKDTDDKVSAVKEALGGTLRQVLAVKASIDFNNTDYADLGDQTYTAQSTYNDHCFAFTVTGVKSFDNNDGVGNILCSKYKSISNGSQLTASYGVSIYKTTLRISDSSFAGKTAAEVAELLKGVLLAYEKA